MSLRVELCALQRIQTDRRESLAVGGINSPLCRVFFPDRPMRKHRRRALRGAHRLRRLPSRRSVVGKPAVLQCGSNFGERGVQLRHRLRSARAAFIFSMPILSGSASCWRTFCGNQLRTVPRSARTAEGSLLTGGCSASHSLNERHYSFCCSSCSRRVTRPSYAKGPVARRPHSVV